MVDDRPNDTAPEADDGVKRRMDRREALSKAAAAAAVAGVAWSAPAVRGMSVVPDYAAAGTQTGLTRTFRILGVSRTSNGNWGDIGTGVQVHDFRGLQTPEVNAAGGTGPGVVPTYNPTTAQVVESSNDPAGHAASLVTMTATLGNAGSVSATMQNNANAYFRADAGSPAYNTNPQYYTAPDRIRIPVTFNVDPPFNQCSVTSGTVYSKTAPQATGDFWDLGSRLYPYPNPLPETYPGPDSPEVTTTAATIEAPPPTSFSFPQAMTIQPATVPNTSGTFTQIVTVENRDGPGGSDLRRIVEIRFVVTC